MDDNQPSVETLLKELRHAKWEVRWHAAREIYFRKEIRALAVLQDLLQNDPNQAVRLMASQALGALYEIGATIPQYPHPNDTSPETRRRFTVQRLKELGVNVTTDDDFDRIYIPHELPHPAYLEIGYLMAQLTDQHFPQGYSPFSDVPSVVIPTRGEPDIQFRESYPAYMKFMVKRQGK
ncbi:MAG: HEAT repeat domain-containing protein [Chloroflexota bacterium]